MKAALPIGLLCLALGFGAGWVAKPASSPEVADNPPSKAEAKKPAGSSPTPLRTPESSVAAKSGDKPANPGVTRKVIVNGEEVAGEQAGRMQNRWQEMMDKRRKAKQDAQIQKLIDSLNLSDDQVAKVRAYFENNDVDLSALMQDGANADWSKIKDLTRTLGGEGLDEALADILTDEQKLAYDEMKQRERANKIEARAYKDLAKVQSVLDLSQEQKDQVYDILYQQAEANVDKNREANAMFSMFTAGTGFELDAEDLGFASAFQTQIEQAADGEQVDDDPNAWMRIMQENRQRQIDERVERLAPALDESQEAAYRAHLENQGGGIFGGAWMEATEVDGVEVEVESLTIPAGE